MANEKQPARIKRPGLGKGIESLTPKAPVPSVNAWEEEAKKGGGVREIAVDEITAHADQPRKYFDEEALEELAKSIRQVGVLQPILVVKRDSKYMIVSGERRYRASLKAGLKTIPAVEMALTDEKVDEIAIIENIQREDLSPLEEARAYQALMRRYGYTQEQVSEKVGKKRSTVTNAIRLLKLPEEILSGLEENKISAGHARALAGLKTEADMKKYFRMILEKGLSVRNIENLISGGSEKKKTDDGLDISIPKTAKKAGELTDLESMLMEKLGTRVVINGTEKKGKIVIDYYSLDDLNRLYDLLGGESSGL